MRGRAGSYQFSFALPHKDAPSVSALIPTVSRLCLFTLTSCPYFLHGRARRPKLVVMTRRGAVLTRADQVMPQGEYKADVYFAGEKAKAASISMMHR